MQLVKLAVGLAFLVVLGRGVYLVAWPQPRLDRLLEDQFQTKVTLSTRRGNIFDRNGHGLALSALSYSIYADPKLIKDPARRARQLSSILQIPVSTLKGRLNRRTRFVWLKRKASAEVYKKVAALNEPGLRGVKEYKRYYPYGSRLAQGLGFTGDDGEGLEGLEAYYNKELKKERQRRQVVRDAKGRALVESSEQVTPAEEPWDLYLTIDSELQKFAEESLVEVINRFQAQRAQAVILDAQTSAILAMASLPSYSPNSPFVSSPSNWRNRVVTDAFEPGSTIKTFTVGAALESQKFRPNTLVDCGDGEVEVDGRIISEADTSHRFAELTLTEILARSSNVGTTNVALEIGAARLRRTLFDFGFGGTTGVDLPGEAKGILHSLPWRSHLLSNISFGQGMTASALQVANAYAAIANGGHYFQPYIVQRKVHHLTGQQVVTSPKKVRRVLSHDNARLLTLMLISATQEEGTGKAARVPGYLVAGKTGTAQKVDFKKGGYKKGAYISSFAGFFPADQPRYVIYVAVDEPQKEYYGSTVAAPLFARLASFALRRSGLAPTHFPWTEKNQLDFKKRLPMAPFSASVGEQSAVMPQWQGLTVREVMRQARQKKLKVRFVGHGLVDTTEPPAGESLDFSDEVTVHFKELQ